MEAHLRKSRPGDWERGRRGGEKEENMGHPGSGQDFSLPGAETRALENTRAGCGSRQGPDDFLMPLSLRKC